MILGLGEILHVSGGTTRPLGWLTCAGQIVVDRAVRSLVHPDRHDPWRRRRADLRSAPAWRPCADDNGNGFVQGPDGRDRDGDAQLEPDGPAQPCVHLDRRRAQRRQPRQHDHGRPGPGGLTVFGYFPMTAPTRSSSTPARSASPAGRGHTENIRPYLAVTFSSSRWKGIFRLRVDFTARRPPTRHAEQFPCPNLFSAKFASWVSTPRPAAGRHVIGQILPIAQNTALFSLLGTNFGGNRPDDLRASGFPRPPAYGRRTEPRPVALCRRRGRRRENVTLMLNELPAHNHGVAHDDDGGHRACLQRQPARPGANRQCDRSGITQIRVYSSGQPNVPMSPNVLRPTGGSQPHNNMMPYLGLTFCIAMAEYFPAARIRPIWAGSRATEERYELEPYVGEFEDRVLELRREGLRALCNGQILAIAQNQALFSLLGTTFGGNGTTTFALPDLRGRGPVHSGTMPGGGTYVPGQRAGETSHTLLVSELPLHPHTASGNNTVDAANQYQHRHEQHLARPVDRHAPTGPAFTANMYGSGTPTVRACAQTIRAGWRQPATRQHAALHGAQLHHRAGRGYPSRN